MEEQERYRERVRNAFEKFLISPFIEYKPYSIDDERIISDAKNRSVINYNGGLLQAMQSYASIFIIDGERKMEYNGKKFKTLLLKPIEGKSKMINFSDFQYYTSFYNGENDSSCFGFDYDETNARFINLFDDRTVIPDSLANQIGESVLMGYSFQTINKFGSMRTCYRFYSLKGDVKNDANVMRRQILRAQAFALLLAAKYPTLCLPSYDYEHLYPYMYDITKEIGSQYSQRLRVKLSEVERALNEHGLTYEHNI